MRPAGLSHDGALLEPECIPHLRACEPGRVPGRRTAVVQGHDRHTRRRHQEGDAPGRPDKQVGSFRLNLKSGQVKDLQITNMPRLIIPYQEIAIEGKIDGPRINIAKLALKSDFVSLAGSGFVESGEPEQTIDMKLSYEGRSAAFPLKGKGTINITGSQSAPIVSVASPDAPKGPEEMKQAAAPGATATPAAAPQAGQRAVSPSVLPGTPAGAARAVVQPAAASGQGARQQGAQVPAATGPGAPPRRDAR